MFGFRIHREGFESIVIAAIISMVLIAAAEYTPVVISALLVIVAGFLFLIVLQFFRNPVRKIPVADNNLVYAPADG
ncbi:MAG: phosphatidylserine decarboxylase family protein, partial [Saprospiraceae bacterium]|nr:phosphatidylserine decarboxylase family protein [Saprospiraceae bacterium]